MKTSAVIPIEKGYQYLCLYPKGCVEAAQQDQPYFFSLLPFLAFSLPFPFPLSMNYLNGEDYFRYIPKDVWRLPSKTNPIVPCNTIPSLDLSPWKGNGSFFILGSGYFFVFGHRSGLKTTFSDKYSLNEVAKSLILVVRQLRL